jgi:hypothetical protein
LSLKEYARVQQFPDDWAFQGSVSDKYRQIGNAVPVGLGYTIGTAPKRLFVNLEKLNGEVLPITSTFGVRCSAFSVRHFPVTPGHVRVYYRMSRTKWFPHRATPTVTPHVSNKGVST